MSRDRAGRGAGIKCCFEIAVADAIRDGVESSGIRVAGEADLYGGRGVCENGQAIAGGVLAEIHEDVDFVLPDHFGEGIVGHADGAAPEIGLAAKFRGQWVRSQHAGVATDFECAMIVVAKER